jgi:hypothetical protein
MSACNNRAIIVQSYSTCTSDVNKESSPNSVSPSRPILPHLTPSSSTHRPSGGSQLSAGSTSSTPHQSSLLPYLHHPSSLSLALTLRPSLSTQIILPACALTHHGHALRPRLLFNFAQTPPLLYLPPLRPEKVVCLA